MQQIKEKLVYGVLGLVLGITIERFVIAPGHRATDVEQTAAVDAASEFTLNQSTTWQDLVDKNRDVNSREANSKRETSESGSRDDRRGLADNTERAEFLARLRQLLNKQLWDEAIALYEEYLRGNEDDDQAIKDLFVEFSQRLRNDHDFDGALQLGQSYLGFDYRDVDFRIEMAANYEALNLWQKSLESYQIGLTYADALKDRKKLQLSLLNFVLRTDKRFAQDDLSTIVDLYESLIELNLDDRYLNGIYYRLAELYFKQGRQSRAIESLSMLEADGEWGLKSQQLLDDYLPPGESQSNNNAETIALARLGEHYVVDVTLGRRQNARLLIDTGASMSVLAKSYFQGAESDVESIRLGTRRFSTAGGRVRAPYYLLSSIELNSQSVKDVGVAIMDIELPPDVDGLLGMNVLKHFSFQIDQDRRELVLQAR